VKLLSTAILAIALLAACGTDADDGSDGADDGSDDADDGSDGSDDGDDAEPEGLQGTTAAHNQARAALGLDPLTWDPDLAAIAQNIYGTSGPAEGTEAVQLWLDEESSYDYDSNTCSAACGHYTQIVWSTTTKLGCAVHNCPALGFGNTVICDYAPGGNDGGRPY
jgi:pathogenesis-related protein 1